MPCHIYPTRMNVIEIMERENKLKEEINKLTDLLCTMCRTVKHMEVGPQYLNMPTDVYDWWRSHQKIDKKRREQRKQEKINNKIRKRVLERLTETERKLLGVS